jgi:hypothetical protein
MKFSGNWVIGLGEKKGRNEITEKTKKRNRLAEAPAKLLCPVTTVGAQLSNAAYNLKQRDDVPVDAREILTELQRAWDDAIRAIPNKWRI